MDSMFLSRNTVDLSHLLLLDTGIPNIQPRRNAHTRQPFRTGALRYGVRIQGHACSVLQGSVGPKDEERYINHGEAVELHTCKLRRLG